MKNLTFRQRLAVAHLAAIVIVLALAAAGGYWSLARSVHGQLDAALLALAETEHGLLPERSDQQIVVHEVPQAVTPSFVRLDRLVQIIDGEGRVIARSENLGDAQLPASRAVLKSLSEGEVVFQTLSAFGDEPVRMVTVPVKGHDIVRGIQVAGSLDDVNHVVKTAGALFLLMGIALFLAVGLAGRSLTRRVFSAIDNVVERAHRIGEENLSERLPHPGTPDEIGRLVDTLNDMLARIERGFEAQRRFAADASHELRSPLSRLRTELEVTLRRPRDTAEYREALHSCLEEVARLTVLVDELLALARVDAGQDRGVVESVSVDRVLAEAVQRLGPVARERDVHLETDVREPAVASIGTNAASVVLANLIDNAIKFSPAGGTIRLSLQASQDEAVLTVTDTGPGIPPEELPHVFERFYRGQGPRNRSTPGVGLGLALSQAIVRAHGGRIEALNAPEGGSMFVVRLPLSTATPNRAQSLLAKA